MAFTYDLTTSRGQVRFGIGDTSASVPIFTNDEIDHFLSIGGTVEGAINEGLRHLLTYHAWRLDADRVTAIKEALSVRGGDLPKLSVTYPQKLPMDRGFDESSDI